jgi:hypothetical protein
MGKLQKAEDNNTHGADMQTTLAISRKATFTVHCHPLLA